MQHILNMSKRLSIVYEQGLLTFSFMESSILTVMFIFNFFLVCKLCLFFWNILYFWYSDDFGGYLVAYFERWVLTLGYFSDVFLLSSKLYKSGLHMIPHFEQEQYSIRGFLELVSVKCSCLTTMQMTQFWSANYICLVHELKFLF